MLLISTILSITKFPPEQRVDRDGMIQSYARSSTSTSTSTKNSQNKTMHRSGRSAALNFRNHFGVHSVMVAVRPDTRHILIVSQFTMPKTEIAIFLCAVATSTCSVRALDTIPIESSDASWMRYQCNTENSQAIIAIGEHCQLPNDSVVTISTDIRRLCWVTRIFGDLALVNAICRIAIDLGGKPMDAIA